MEPWRFTWRKAAPLLSTKALTALRKALEEDDHSLIQGATVSPPALLVHKEWPCEGACLLGYALWRGDGLTTVGEVEDGFFRLFTAIGEAMGDPTGARHLTCYWDEEDRGEATCLILAAVCEELKGRAGNAA